VLGTFEQERVDTARQLIEFDTTFSHIFSGKMGSDDPAATGLTHEEFLRVFREGSGFTSGCGLQYQPSSLVKTPACNSSSASPGRDSLNGALIPGTRLLNVELKRYADNTTRQLHDGESLHGRPRKRFQLTTSTEIPSTGRYRIMVLASTDLLDASGTSQAALSACVDITQKFPAGLIELVVVHPMTKRFEWSDLPSCVKKAAEMRTYGLSKSEDAYDVYGVGKESGVIATVRPDGYVGMLSSLSDSTSVEAYFRGCLVSV
jgi:phenol 2-monooxygenase